MYWLKTPVDTTKKKNSKLIENSSTKIIVQTILFSSSKEQYKMLNTKYLTSLGELESRPLIYNSLSFII